MSNEGLNAVLFGANAEYIAHLYNHYLTHPEKVDASWRSFFDGLDDNETALLHELHGASWTPVENQKDKNGFSAFAMGTGIQDVHGHDIPEKSAVQDNNASPANDDQTRQATIDSVRALMLIRAFRARGHLLAELDPLGLKEKAYHPELDPKHYGFSEDDYDRSIFLNNVLGMEYATLREIMKTLKETYCGRIGVEFLHMSDPDEKAWIQQRIESAHNQTDFSENGKTAILQRVTAAEGFENFLHTKYPGTKRFGVDGGEALIPLVEQIMKRGGQLGLEEIILGMPHRGRLNVLTNIMGKSFTAVFAEFLGKSTTPDEFLGSSDVKYHLGTSSDRDFDGNNVHISLTANPSHLEAVNPVVIGKVRAKQVQRNDKDAVKVMPILMHGDAAFAGQGLVAETLMISDLPGYRVGGTMHIIVNNQIGFTTTPQFARSGPYPTDVAKMLSAPIFHVNGDDPEAVVHVARIATEFRQEFGKDVVIDMLCYRRYGHNEGDEPMFTQPVMYKKIAKHKTTREIYASHLIAEGTITEADAKKMVDDFKSELEEAFEAAKSYKPNKADFLEGKWSGFKQADTDYTRGDTAISEEMLKEVGKQLTTVPDDFALNKKLERLFDAKRKMFDGLQEFDWGTAENLAHATLLKEGFGVRISGQDVGRGTFSHRHAILYDQNTAEKYYPMQHISDDQGRFEVHDSPLSEAAVLGFEYGYTLAEPNTLVTWEAQFGDFANCAQVHFDQFISTGEVKWLRMSGLVMQLPHGYEGQGPEHSSARLERFLQSCGEDNWQVLNCTTPANYFHALRRQMHRDFRKPMVVMSPKSLLRHKLATSPISMFTGDSSFHRYLWDDDLQDLVKADKVKRVILCSGKVYYDLLEERRKRGIKDIVITRVEQLYPFPLEPMAEELAQYPKADIVWCQEEPRNMGAWSFIHERLEDALTMAKHKAGRPQYAGRPEAASPATGLASRHAAEQAKLIDDALTL
jgi:2-oxoglutarate dehydrogenase E1 component